MATTKGPGKSYRKGMSLLEVTEQFNTVEKGEQWFIEQRWPNGIACPHCGGLNVATVASRKPTALPVSGMPQALLGQDGYRPA